MRDAAVFECRCIHGRDHLARRRHAAVPLAAVAAI
jgi:hypothetical protein